ncbi:MAG TPA: aminotransferase class III-fold pyridoxal phosphate-dependent enzyme [Planctomycetota bacterium]|nr:aminotransferase class III-fold pyridoxal phosphate-dependent enzyme [Planctomycetota bacterium]
MRGRGAWIEDAEGKRYLDASGGAMVVSLGHGLASIARAMGRQAATLAYANGTQFTSEPLEGLADDLASIAPKGLTRALFLTSGSEANEAAVKLALQYWIDRGVPGKTRILARRPAYHGNTLATLSLGSRGTYRRFFGDWVRGVARIPGPYCYRCALGLTYPFCKVACADELEKAIEALGEETIAAFIAEPVFGASGAAAVPPADYWKRIRAICDRHSVLWIADEVLSGMGRTGRWFAVDHYGVVPDILTLGKGLSGGYAPLSAMMAREEIVETIRRAGHDLQHQQTFSQTPLVCAAGRAAIRVLKRRKLVERVARMEKGFLAALEGLRRFASVGDVRGKGLLAGIEFVADRETRRPFPREARFCERVADEALERGLVVWAQGGDLAGEDGDAILLAPPFTVTRFEIAAVAKRLGAAIDAVEVARGGARART